METLREFKKMSYWDFKELLEEKCLGCHDKETYFTYLMEIKMRRIESISEGGNIKLKNLALNLYKEFQNENEQDSEFCSPKDLEEFRYIIENEI